MRPVDKGRPQRTYSTYGDARHDLAQKIGYYCSYCEMKVFHSIEVEHVLPQNQGGSVIDWNNFLLSCKYCNTIKSDHNKNLVDYLWPDLDNTDLAFLYSENKVIEPKTSLANNLTLLAQKTIRLTGIDRIPGGIEPTQADTRWRSRKEAWDLAKTRLAGWMNCLHPELAKAIGTCSLNGHYSIWCEVFKNEPIVLKEIDLAYKTIGLYKEFNNNKIRIIRTGGRI